MGKREEERARVLPSPVTGAMIKHVLDLLISLSYQHLAKLQHKYNAAQERNVCILPLN